MRDERRDDPRPEDDQEAIDRAFAELVADFHWTRDPRPGDSSQPPEHGAEPDAEPDVEPPEPFVFRLDLDGPIEPEPGEREERYVPPPLPPIGRPNPPILVGWLGIGYAIVAMLLLAFDVPLPRWAGWIAIGTFLGGLALLLSQLPRHRRSDDDDGARI